MSSNVRRVKSALEKILDEPSLNETVGEEGFCASAINPSSIARKALSTTEKRSKQLSVELHPELDSQPQGVSSTYTILSCSPPFDLETQKMDDSSVEKTRAASPCFASPSSKVFSCLDTHHSPPLSVHEEETKSLSSISAGDSVSLYAKPVNKLTNRGLRPAPISSFTINRSMLAAFPNVSSSDVKEIPTFHPYATKSALKTKCHPSGSGSVMPSAREEKNQSLDVFAIQDALKQSDVERIELKECLRQLQDEFSSVLQTLERKEIELLNAHELAQLLQRQVHEAEEAPLEVSREAVEALEKEWQKEAYAFHEAEEALVKERDNLRTTVEAQQVDLHCLQERLKQKEKENEELHMTQQQLEGEAAEIKSRMEALDGYMTSMEALLKERDEAISTLESRLAEAEKEKVLSLTEMKARSKTEQDTVMAELKELRSALDHQTSEVRKKMHRILMIEKEKKLLQAEVLQWRKVPQAVGDQQSILHRSLLLLSRDCQTQWRDLLRLSLSSCPTSSSAASSELKTLFSELNEATEVMGATLWVDKNSSCAEKKRSKEDVSDVAPPPPHAVIRNIATDNASIIRVVQLLGRRYRSLVSSWTAQVKSIEEAHKTAVVEWDEQKKSLEAQRVAAEEKYADREKKLGEALKECEQSKLGLEHLEESNLRLERDLKEACQRYERLEEHQSSNAGSLNRVASVLDQRQMELEKYTSETEAIKLQLKESEHRVASLESQLLALRESKDEEIEKLKGRLQKQIQKVKDVSAEKNALETLQAKNKTTIVALNNQLSTLRGKLVTCKKNLEKDAENSASTIAGLQESLRVLKLQKEDEKREAIKVTEKLREELKKRQNSAQAAHQQELSYKNEIEELKRSLENHTVAEKTTLDALLVTLRHRENSLHSPYRSEPMLKQRVRDRNSVSPFSGESFPLTVSGFSPSASPHRSLDDACSSASPVLLRELRGAPNVFQLREEVLVKVTELSCELERLTAELHDPREPRCASMSLSPSPYPPLRSESVDSSSVSTQCSANQDASHKMHSNSAFATECGDAVAEEVAERLPIGLPASTSSQQRAALSSHADFAVPVKPHASKHQRRSFSSSPSEPYSSNKTPAKGIELVTAQQRSRSVVAEPRTASSRSVPPQATVADEPQKEALSKCPIPEGIISAGMVLTNAPPKANPGSVAPQAAKFEKTPRETASSISEPCTRFSYKGSIDGSGLIPAPPVLH